MTVCGGKQKSRLSFTTKQKLGCELCWKPQSMNMKIEEEIDFPCKLCVLSLRVHRRAVIAGMTNTLMQIQIHWKCWWRRYIKCSVWCCWSEKKTKQNMKRGKNKAENSLLAILFIFFFHFRATLKSRQVFNVHGDESHLRKPILLRGSEDPANYTDVKQSSICCYCLPATAEEY